MRCFFPIFFFLVSSLAIKGQNSTLNILSQLIVDSVLFYPESALIKQTSSSSFIIQQQKVCLTIFFKDGIKKKCLTPPYSVLEFVDLNDPVDINTVVINHKNPNIPINITKKIQSINIGGENDPIITSTSLPGIQSAGEFQQGIYVRGSSSDKNKFTLDNATIYAPFHQFGLFSVFNDDLIKSATITTNYFDGKHGGRTAGFMDIKTKKFLQDSSQKSIHIGLLSSKLFYHKRLGPKSNFLTSFRGTYGNHIAKPFLNEGFKIYFYDGSMKFNFNPNEKLIWSIGSHFSTDKNNIIIQGDDRNVNSLVGWYNWTNIYNLKKIIEKKSYLALTLSNSNFHLSNEAIKEGFFSNDQNEQEYRKVGLALNSNIIDYKSELLYHTKYFEIGGELTRHLLNPEFIYQDNTEGELKYKEDIKTLESASYFQVNLNNKSFDFKGSIRLNSFLNNNFYHYATPRIGLIYKLNNKSNIAFSFDNTSQFIYSLPSNGLGLPTDIWIATSDLAPIQKTKQTTFSYNFTSDLLSLKSSYFIKSENGIVAYKPGNSFSVSNEGVAFSTEKIAFSERLISGQQLGSGIEFLFEVQQKGHSESLSYTYSNFRNQFDEKNRGDWFESDQNRPHKLTINVQTKLSKQYSIIASWNLNSGRNASFLNTTYNYSARYTSYDLNVQYLNQVNNFKYPIYHRLDLKLSSKKITSTHTTEWSIGLINAYNKRNINFYITDAGVLKSVSLLPIFPTANIKWTW